MNGVDSWPAPPDEMLMMLPPPVAVMCGTTAAADEVEAADVDAHRLVPLVDG